MKKSGNKEEIMVYGENSIPLLQHIIDGISNKPVKSTPHSIDFSRLKKLKISIRKKYGQPYIKCRVKYEGQDDIPIDRSRADDKPDYRVLKKRMEKTFKTIGDRLKNGSFPSHLETELFCANAALMTTYPGHGDDMYPTFLQLVNEFQDAFHQADIQKCQAKFDEIKAMKKACHQDMS